MDRECAKCRYSNRSDLSCCFPKPQDGTEPLFMVTGAMPDSRCFGGNCFQFVAVQAQQGEGQDDG